MNAHIRNCLKDLDNVWRSFEHNDQPLSKEEVKAALLYGLKKGYETIYEITDEDFDLAMKELYEEDSNGN